MTRNITRLGAGVAALAVAAVVGSGVASAGPQDWSYEEFEFVHHLNSIGIAGDGDALVRDGWTICGLLASGVPAQTIAATIFYNSNRNPFGITRTQADAEVLYAIDDLCPSVAGMSRGLVT